MLFLILIRIFVSILIIYDKDFVECNTTCTSSSDVVNQNSTRGSVDQTHSVSSQYTHSVEQQEEEPLSTGDSRIPSTYTTDSDNHNQVDQNQPSTTVSSQSNSTDSCSSSKTFEDTLSKLSSLYSLSSFPNNKSTTYSPRNLRSTSVLPTQNRKPGPFSPSSYEFLTSEDLNGTNLVTNDVSKYELKDYYSRFVCNFKLDTKCFLINCDGLLLWKYDSNIHKNIFPKSLEVNGVKKTAVVKFDSDWYYTYEYSNSKWNWNITLSKGYLNPLGSEISTFSFKIITLDDDTSVTDSTAESLDSLVTLSSVVSGDSTTEELGTSKESLTSLSVDLSKEQKSNESQDSQDSAGPSSKYQLEQYQPKDVKESEDSSESSSSTDSNNLKYKVNDTSKYELFRDVSTDSFLYKFKSDTKFIEFKILNQSLWKYDPKLNRGSYPIAFYINKNNKSFIVYFPGNLCFVYAYVYYYNPQTNSIVFYVTSGLTRQVSLATRFSPSNFTVVTADNSTGSNLKFNDISKYRVYNFDYYNCLIYIFNDGAKCIEFKYMDAAVWRYDSNEDKDSYPKLIQIDSSQKSCYIQFDTHFYMYKYEYNQWKLNKELTFKSKLLLRVEYPSEIKIMTQEENDQTQENEIKEDTGNGYKVLEFSSCNTYLYVFNDNVKCAELKYDDQEVWKHDPKEHEQQYPKAIYYNSVKKSILVEFDMFWNYTYELVEEHWVLKHSQMKKIDKNNQDKLSIDEFKVSTLDDDSLPKSDTSVTESTTSSVVTSDNQQVSSTEESTKESEDSTQSSSALSAVKTLEENKEQDGDSSVTPTTTTLTVSETEDEGTKESESSGPSHTPAVKEPQDQLGTDSTSVTSVVDSKESIDSLYLSSIKYKVNDISKYERYDFKNINTTLYVFKNESKCVKFEYGTKLVWEYDGSKYSGIYPKTIEVNLVEGLVVIKFGNGQYDVYKLQDDDWKLGGQEQPIVSQENEEEEDEDSDDEDEEDDEDSEDEQEYTVNEGNNLENNEDESLCSSEGSVKLTVSSVDQNEVNGNQQEQGSTGVDKSKESEDSIIDSTAVEGNNLLVSKDEQDGVVLDSSVDDNQQELDTCSGSSEVSSHNNNQEESEQSSGYLSYFS